MNETGITPERRDIKACREMLSRLCKAVWNPAERVGHLWSIPADPRRDFDCMFSDVFDEVEQSRTALDTLTAQLAEARQERNKMRLGLADVMVERDRARSDAFAEAVRVVEQMSPLPPIPGNDWSLGWDDAVKAILTQLRDAATRPTEE